MSAGFKRGLMKQIFMRGLMSMMGDDDDDTSGDPDGLDFDTGFGFDAPILDPGWDTGARGEGLQNWREKRAMRLLRLSGAGDLKRGRELSPAQQLILSGGGLPAAAVMGAQQKPVFARPSPVGGVPSGVAQQVRQDGDPVTFIIIPFQALAAGASLPVSVLPPGTIFASQLSIDGTAGLVVDSFLIGGVPFIQGNGTRFSAARFFPGSQNTPPLRRVIEANQQVQMTLTNTTAAPMNVNVVIDAIFVRNQQANY